MHTKIKKRAPTFKKVLLTRVDKRNKAIGSVKCDDTYLGAHLFKFGKHTAFKVRRNFNRWTSYFKPLIFNSYDTGEYPLYS